MTLKKRKTNSTKAASILNWALLKEDALKSPSDPGKPGPMGVPRTHIAFLSVHISRFRGAVHWGPGSNQVISLYQVHSLEGDN